MKKIALTAGFAVAACQSSLAVFPFLVETDGSGAFLQGGYTGDGTVQSNVVAGSFGGSGLNNALLVQGFNSGVLSFDTSVAPIGTRVSADLSATVGVSFTGASGDLYVANSAGFDGGDDKFNSFGLSGLAGVTSITVTVSYNQHVAGRNSSLAGLDNRPLLAGLALINAGTGLGLDSFDVTMSLGGAHSSTDGVNFFASAPGVPSHSSAAWDTVSGGGLNYAADGFAGTVPLGGSSTNFLMVRGFDFDGGGYGAADAEKFYADTQTWTITPRNGASSFADDTSFTFSMDGQQYPNAAVVPEATSFLFSALAGLIGLGYRRRK